MFLDPKCSEKANMLMVSLGKDHSVKPGVSLTLKTGNNIRELKSESDYGEEASGTVTIVKPKSSKSKPNFKLSSPSEVCPGSSFAVEVSDMKGYGRGEKQINWYIDSVPTGSVDQTSLDRLKNSAYKSKDKRKMTIQSSLVNTYYYIQGHNHYLLAR